jgi:hypothetical protein
VGIGNDSGFAWAVRAKYYPATQRTYAFVGDATGPDAGFTDGAGRVLVFDVSGDQLYPAATTPYRPKGGTWNAVLRPLAAVSFPRDPVDGYGSSVTDIQLDPAADFAYVGLGRGGYAVLDVSIPTSPVIVAIIDTPGLVLGLTVRQDEGGRSQLIVSDTRGGMRLYCRPGE